MNITTETLNEFLALASQTSTWDNSRPGLWVRSSKTNGWTETPTADDPYTTLPIAVSLTPKGGENEVMFLMYGTARPLDDGDDDDVREPLVGRVRVLVYFRDGDQCVSVQMKGQTIDNTYPDMGEGMFADALRVLRDAQEMGE